GRAIRHSGTKVSEQGHVAAVRRACRQVRLGGLVVPGPHDFLRPAHDRERSPTLIGAASDMWRSRSDNDVVPRFARFGDGHREHMAVVQSPTRSVPTRPMEFDAWFGDLPAHFAADGDILTSHVLAVLSSVFPDGEDYFVRSVEAVRDRIEDPRLRQDVDGFIGQESMHGREHRALNERLAELGYPTRAIATYVQKLTALRERFAGERSNLAFTAALEHYT